MFEAIYYGLTKIVIGFCLIISPIVLLLSFIGVVEWESAFEPIAFYIFTLIDIALLFWWASRERKRMIALISICVVIAIALCIPPLMKLSERNHAYEEAMELIEKKRYMYAADVLKPYAEYDDKEIYALWNLCEAHVRYYSEEVISAGAYASSYDFSMPLMKKLESEEAFVQRVIEEARILREKEKEAEWEQWKRAQRQKVATGVPFVGMSESDIDNTSLGKHSGEIRHNYEVKDGNSYIANLYDFVRYGKRIFTARCVDGKVYQVWDYRD